MGESKRAHERFVAFQDAVNDNDAAAVLELAPGIIADLAHLTTEANWGYETVASLREAIRRLADQDATLSVQGGNVIVEMDATLTDAEREAVAWAERFARSQRDSQDNAADYAATLRSLLERTKGETQNDQTH